MNEQQHLEEVIGRFLQNTRENEEISKEEAIYLKRRIRPAMEYLIVQENIDGMKKMADRGWFGEQELNGFLTRAGELKKWDAFRVLLAWKNHISTKEKSPNTATKQELITGLMKHCKNELCWRYPELGRALLELRVQPNEQVTAMRTDGESLYVNPEHTVQVIDGADFPEMFKPLASNMGKALEELRTRNDVKWTYVSPAGDFQADGERKEPESIFWEAKS